MAANLDPAELAALQQAAPATRAARAVSERDFGQPRRLTREALDEAARRVEATLSGVEQELSRWLRAPLGLQLASTGEVDAREVLREVRDPLAVVRFQCGGQLGWLIWETPQAVSAVERVLGATELIVEDGETEALVERPLSRLERSVLLRLWRGPLIALGSALGVGLEELVAVGERRAAGSALDAGSQPDLHRLALEFEVRGGPLDSRLRLYLPTTDMRLGARPPQSASPTLPEHLTAVPLPVSVELGRAELQLADLLRLEPGDVIPLDSLCAKPLSLEVDGRHVADVRLGKAHGRLAARLIDAPNLARPAPGAAPDPGPQAA